MSFNHHPNKQVQEFVMCCAIWYHLYHSHRSRKGGLETRAVLLIFSLEFEISGVAVQRIHQNSEKWRLYEELLSENDFEALLTTFCCYGYGSKASEAVQKIATDQKDYHKCSSRVL